MSDENPDPVQELWHLATTEVPEVAEALGLPSELVEVYVPCNHGRHHVWTDPVSNMDVLYPENELFSMVAVLLDEENLIWLELTGGDPYGTDTEQIISRFIGHVLDTPQANLAQLSVSALVDFDDTP